MNRMLIGGDSAIFQADTRGIGSRIIEVGSGLRVVV
jgi:hypothetical protein